MSTITIKIGKDEIPGIPAALSVDDIRESLADLRPEVANYAHVWSEDRKILQFVPRPANKGNEDIVTKEHFDRKTKELYRYYENRFSAMEDQLKKIVKGVSMRTVEPISGSFIVVNIKKGPAQTIETFVNTSWIMKIQHTEGTTMVVLRGGESMPVVESPAQIMKQLEKPVKK